MPRLRAPTKIKQERPQANQQPFVQIRCFPPSIYVLLHFYVAHPYVRAVPPEPQECEESALTGR